MFSRDDSDWKHDLKVAVVTAGLTALITGLVEWVVDELREKYGSPEAKGTPKPKDPKDPKDQPKSAP